MARNLNTKSLVVLAMAPRKQKTVESGGIGLMSDGREAYSVPFPICRKFINRLALAEHALQTLTKLRLIMNYELPSGWLHDWKFAIKRCNDNDDDNCLHYVFQFSTFNL